MHDKIIARTRTGFIEVYAIVQEWTVTFTLNLATWFLFETYCLIMIIICAILFSNPTMHNKVMGPKRTAFTEVYAQSLSADCNLDLRPHDMILVCNTSSCHADHLCKKYFQIPLCIRSYESDTNRFH